ncbi:hypothetical protein [Polyangium jinanense]|uniref:Uncharacterized protein n=1 Tax=Polyangium jinanense TaxID=2829994 RepID=A0A9X3XGG8_9BACT|nr:hypothetical protein [Polyangium jinanense]MDC3958392.1 hypothetical protein [Polyangium jinanense]MDC3988278.1 hypothetical protein [Polyangium jinanense]
MRSLHRILFLGILVVLQAACGGKVVIDRDGQGGSDPIDQEPSDVCPSYCSAEVALGCFKEEAGCVSSCENSLGAVGSCAALLGAAYTCLGQNISPSSNCNKPPPPCTDEIEAFQTCVASAPCTSLGECHVSAGDCNCTNECGGALLESDCNTDTGGVCTCRFNGEVVGTCTPTTTAVCDNLVGCCAGLFAASH